MQFARLTLEICGNNTSRVANAFSICEWRVESRGDSLLFIVKCQTTTSSQAVTMTREERDRTIERKIGKERERERNWQLGTCNVPLATTSGQVAASGLKPTKQNSVSVSVSLLWTELDLFKWPTASLTPWLNASLADRCLNFELEQNMRPTCFRYPPQKQLQRPQLSAASGSLCSTLYTLQMAIKTFSLPLIFIANS